MARGGGSPSPQGSLRNLFQRFKPNLYVISIENNFDLEGKSGYITLGRILKTTDSIERFNVGRARLEGQMFSDNGTPSDPTVAQLEADLKDAARKFTEENLNNPGSAEHLLIHSAMLIAWEMGVKQSIAHMKEHGIYLGKRV